MRSTDSRRSASEIRLRNTTSQRCISEEARNTYSELAIRHEGIDAGIIGLRSLKFKRCAELDGAARLRLTFALVSSVRPNRYSTEERHSQVKNEARCKTTHLKSWCEKHITKPIARFTHGRAARGLRRGRWIARCRIRHFRCDVATTGMLRCREPRRDPLRAPLYRCLSSNRCES